MLAAHSRITQRLRSALRTRNGAEPLCSTSPAEPLPDYPQLRTALSRALADVGDFIEIGDADAARDAMRRAAAIESELSAAVRASLDGVDRPGHPHRQDP
jgi:hypothetical protein